MARGHDVERTLAINGERGIVSYRRGSPQSVFTIEASGGRISAINVVTSPEELSRLPPPPS